MIEILLFLTLLIVGYVSGRINEKMHFESIIKREAGLKSILTFNERFPPPQAQPVDAELVAGNVVISIDYFKKVASGLRTLVGGRMSSFESLVERARREAILRMKEEAQSKGANAIFNVKLETASIYKGNGSQIGSVEVYAYGTAIIPKTH